MYSEFTKMSSSGFSDGKYMGSDFFSSLFSDLAVIYEKCKVIEVEESIISSMS